MSKARAVLAEGSHVLRPEADALRTFGRAGARADHAVEGNADDGEIGFGGRKVWAMQVSPKPVGGGGIGHGASKMFTVSTFIVLFFPLAIQQPYEARSDSR